MASEKSLNAFRAYLRWSKRLPVSARLGSAVALVVLAAIARWLLEPWLAGYPYLLFFAAVVLSSTLLDNASGFLATVLSGLVAAYFFVLPHFSLALTHSGDVAALFVFFGVCFLIVVASETLRYLAEAMDEEQAQKDALFRQLTHRTRNNLQIISSTLAIQAIKARNPEIRSYLDAVAERIGNIGRIHQRLYPPGAPEDIDSTELLEGTCEDLSLLLAGRRPVLIQHETESFSINRELAASLAIITGELVDNAFKHAFPDGRPGAISVRMEKRGREIVLIVQDTGVGCESMIGSGTGTTLVQALVKQLSGTAVWQSTGQGCQATITVKA